jgi:hypothetical protein
MLREEKAKEAIEFQKFQISIRRGSKRDLPL